MEIVTAHDRPDLEAEAGAAFREKWPEFIFHDEVPKRLMPRVSDHFGDFAVLLLAGGTVAAGPGGARGPGGDRASVDAEGCGRARPGQGRRTCSPCCSAARTSLASKDARRASLPSAASRTQQSGILKPVIALSRANGTAVSTGNASSRSLSSSRAERATSRWSAHIGPTSTSATVSALAPNSSSADRRRSCSAASWCWSRASR